MIELRWAVQSSVPPYTPAERLQYRIAVSVDASGAICPGTAGDWIDVPWVMLPEEPKGKVTLAQLAHFNRCLFPANLEEELIRQGIDKHTAKSIRTMYAANVRMGVLGIYQEYIMSEDVINALGRMIDKFITKHP